MSLTSPGCGRRTARGVGRDEKDADALQVGPRLSRALPSGLPRDPRQPQARVPAPVTILSPVPNEALTLPTLSQAVVRRLAALLRLALTLNIPLSAPAPAMTGRARRAERLNDRGQRRDRPGCAIRSNYREKSGVP